MRLAVCEPTLELHDVRLELGMASRQRLLFRGHAANCRVAIGERALELVDAVLRFLQRQLELVELANQRVGPARLGSALERALEQLRGMVRKAAVPCLQLFHPHAIARRESCGVVSGALGGKSRARLEFR